MFMKPSLQFINTNNNILPRAKKKRKAYRIK